MRRLSASESGSTRPESKEEMKACEGTTRGEEISQTRRMRNPRGGCAHLHRLDELGRARVPHLFQEVVECQRHR